LITKESLDLHFKPRPDADRTLRVLPDLLPAGSVQIGAVTLDGKPYEDYDSEQMIVRLPESDRAIKVVVHIVPREGMEHFAVELQDSQLTLSGDLDPRALSYFRSKLTDAIIANPDQLTIDVSAVNSMCKPAARAIAFERGKMSANAVLTLKGANEKIQALFDADELTEEIVLKN